ncbi:hypothetical protein MFRU_009g01040 [Monilinia fructicola]|nr:hypothetical protein MFRU_009g01040 [Monilinia fructicola]
MLVVFLSYTVLIVTTNLAYDLGTNLIHPSDISKLAPESIASRITGSKLVLVVEQSMIMTVWGCKACLLCMFLKMMEGIKPHNLIVKLVAVYVGTGLVMMEILYFGVWCRPFSNYWAVPTPNEQCSTAIHHLIVNAAINISSDLMLLCIPMPLVLKAQLPTLKKILLISVFSLGIFAITSAVANKYFSFENPFDVMWTYWYIREASTVMYVANIPMCWPLARKLFGLRSWSGSVDGTKSKITMVPKKYSSTGSGSRFGNRKENSIYKTESRVGIIDGNQEGSSAGAIGLEIWESREVSVRNEEQSPNGNIENTTTITTIVSRNNSIEYPRSNPRVERVESRQHTLNTKKLGESCDEIDVDGFGVEDVSKVPEVPHDQ